MIGDVSKLILVSKFMFLNSNKFKLRSFLLTHYLWIWSKARSSGDNPLLIHQSIFLYYIYYGISLLSVKIFHRDELFESYLLRNSSNLNVATVPYIQCTLYNLYNSSNLEFYLKSGRIIWMCRICQKLKSAINSNATTLINHKTHINTPGAFLCRIYTN